MFRRRRETDDLDSVDVKDGVDADDAYDEDFDDDGNARPVARPTVDRDEYGANVDYPMQDEAAKLVEHVETTGPWDFRDKPRDDDLPRVDLGGMRVPIPEGVELRVEAQEETIVAAVLIHEQSQILLNAFAAPKRAGIWDDVRTEILGALREAGGSASETTGPFGTELAGQIPDENGGLQPARFIGVDGPRWFLRGLITGAAATNQSAAGILEQAFRSVVVNRGADAMAPRDAIPLHLPRDIVEGAAQAQADATAAEATPTPEFELKERGPEITETR